MNKRWLGIVLSLIFATPVFARDLQPTLTAKQPHAMVTVLKYDFGVIQGCYGLHVNKTSIEHSVLVPGEGYKGVILIEMAGPIQRCHVDREIHAVKKMEFKSKKLNPKNLFSLESSTIYDVYFNDNKVAEISVGQDGAQQVNIL